MSDLGNHIIYRCVVGSRAYGLAHEASDTDVRGIYQAPNELLWSLTPPPEQLEDKEKDLCFWELAKFLRLALKGNPNILECLWTPLVDHATPMAEELRAERGRFLSRTLATTYRGYALSQFAKLERDLRTHGEYRWKHAMHLIRLMLAGISALRDGEVIIEVGSHRDRLLAIRRGEVPFAEMDAWRQELAAELDRAQARTSLPENPDFEWADAFVIRARLPQERGDIASRGPTVSPPAAKIAPRQVGGGGFVDAPARDPRVQDECDAHPYPLLFATISGAHLYGFPSADSDVDLRGVHVLPVRDVIGLGTPRETVELMHVRDGLEVDLVTHDLAKFARLMLRRNGYVLEQLLSPLVIRTTPGHEELIALAPTCITRHHGRHYLGFAANQWKLITKHDPPRVKPALYAFRTLLTGIHLMRTGEVVADLRALNAADPRPFLADLMARKVDGAEKEPIDAGELPTLEIAFRQLVSKLEEAMAASSLPDAPAGAAAVEAFVLRVRKSSS